MLFITGAAGFIGSACHAYFVERGYEDIGLVDDFDAPAKLPNWQHKPHRLRLQREGFTDWLQSGQGKAEPIDCIVHLGARTDTAERSAEVFDRLNLHYSQRLFRICAERGIALIYASSAATYGAGELGYDDECPPASLQPLNPYGRSKNDFDAWVLEQKQKPPFWAGLKFFNVYGPNEYHKGRMASVVLHAFEQIRRTGGMELFRSHRSDCADGEQRRDFVYVRDVLSIIDFLYQNRPESGLYNVGTGEARSFLDLTRAVFRAMNLPERIRFIDMPADIRNSYQYFTQARMNKLRAAGYTKPFTRLEQGVEDYVSGYLSEKRYW